MAESIRLCQSALSLADGAKTLTPLSKLCATSTHFVPIPTTAMLIDEISLASPALLELTEEYRLNAITDKPFTLLNGRVAKHQPVIVGATMNSTAHSKARGSLSTKLQAPSPLLKLPPFTESEMRAIGHTLLQHVFPNPDDVKLILETHFIKASDETQAEENGNTLRELLHLCQFQKPLTSTGSSLGTEALLEMIYTSRLGRKERDAFFGKAEFKSLQLNIRPSCKKGMLEMTPAIRLSLTPRAVGGQATLSLTDDLCHAAALVSAVILAQRPVLLFNPSGTRKTHLSRCLAQAVGTPLFIVQFSTETDSSTIIAALAIDGDKEENKAVKEGAVLFGLALLEVGLSSAIDLLAAVLKLHFELAGVEDVLAPMLISEALAGELRSACYTPVAPVSSPSSLSMTWSAPLPVRSSPSFPPPPSSDLSTEPLPPLPPATFSPPPPSKLSSALCSR